MYIWLALCVLEKSILDYRTWKGHFLGIFLVDPRKSSLWNSQQQLKAEQNPLLVSLLTFPVPISCDLPGSSDSAEGAAFAQAPGQVWPSKPAAFFPKAQHCVFP